MCPESSVDAGELVKKLDDIIKKWADTRLSVGVVNKDDMDLFLNRWKEIRAGLQWIVYSMVSLEEIEEREMESRAIAELYESKRKR